MIQILGAVVYVCGYIFVQEFLLLRLYNVPENRKKCAIIIFVFSVVFLIMEFYLGRRAIEYADEISVLMYNICHMAYTFMTISVIGIYAEGFLPRNFIKIFLYYDVLTTVAYGLFIRNLMYFMFEEEQLTGSIFATEESYQYPIILEYIMQFVIVLAIASVINKYVDMIIGKIPDIACIVVFAAAFITYVFKIIISVSNFKEIMDTESRYDNISIESLTAYMVFIVILIGAVSVTILDLAASRRRYKKVLYIESALQQDYYKAVARVNRRVRELKHDLANHIAVISALKGNDLNRESNKTAYAYSEHLMDLCDQIDNEIQNQLGWRIVKSQSLSERERYELFKYSSNVCKDYDLPLESIRVVRGKDICGCDDSVYTEIRIEVPGIHLKKFFIKRNEWYRMIKRMVETNNGNIKWEAKEGRELLIITV